MVPEGFRAGSQVLAYVGLWGRWVCARKAGQAGARVPGYVSPWGGLVCAGKAGRALALSQSAVQCPPRLAVARLCTEPASMGSLRGPGLQRRKELWHAGRLERGGRQLLRTLLFLTKIRFLCCCFF